MICKKCGGQVDNSLFWKCDTCGYTIQLGEVTVIDEGIIGKQATHFELKIMARVILFLHNNALNIKQGDLFEDLNDSEKDSVFVSLIKDSLIFGSSTLWNRFAPYFTLEKLPIPLSHHKGLYPRVLEGITTGRLDDLKDYNNFIDTIALSHLTEEEMKAYIIWVHEFNQKFNYLEKIADIK